MGGEEGVREGKREGGSEWRGRGREWSRYGEGEGKEGKGMDGRIDSGNGGREGREELRGREGRGRE